MRPKPLRPLTLLLLALAGTAESANSLRCGSRLVSTGDRMFEVEEKCGPPRQRDLIGYALGPHWRRELIIEEWVYGPDNGMISVLRFEGNRLIKIETFRSR